MGPLRPVSQGFNDQSPLKEIQTLHSLYNNYNKEQRLRLICRKIGLHLEP